MANRVNRYPIGIALDVWTEPEIDWVQDSTTFYGSKTYWIQPVKAFQMATNRTVRLPVLICMLSSKGMAAI